MKLNQPMFLSTKALGKIKWRPKYRQQQNAGMLEIAEKMSSHPQVYAKPDERQFSKM